MHHKIILTREKMKNKDRRMIFFIFIFLLSMGVSYAQKFGIKFAGGLSYLSVGDINSGINGYFDLRKNQATEIPRIFMEGDPSPLHLGFNFEINFMMNLTPKWGIGLGVGYVRASNTSEIILQQPGGMK